MLVPDPLNIFVVIAEIAFMGVGLWRIRVAKTAAAEIESKDGKSGNGADEYVISYSRGDTGLAIFLPFFAMVVIIGISLLNGGILQVNQDVIGTPGYITVGFSILVLTIPMPILVVIALTGRFIVVSDQGVGLWSMGKPKRTLEWRSISVLTRYPLAGKPTTIRLSNRKTIIAVRTTMIKIERLYQLATQHLPEEVRDSLAYKWMADSAGQRLARR